MSSIDQLNRLLGKFVSEEIVLDQSDISAAVKSKQWFLDQVKAKIDSGLLGPKLYGPEPWVGYGSYFTRLKVKDVDEMDFLVVMDSRGGFFRREGVNYGYGLGTAAANQIFRAEFLKSDLSGVSPNKLLRWLAAICWEVLGPLGGQNPVVDGPAVKVVLKSKGLKFDLVPAAILERSDYSGRSFYVIPEGKPFDGWIMTNPVLDRERVDRVADACDDFRNVTRLVKLVRDGYNLPVSSYAIQCTCCELAEKFGWDRGPFVNFKRALSYLDAKIAEGKIEDGFDPSINLLTAQNLGQVRLTIQKLHASLQCLEGEVLEEAAYDKLWALLMNRQRSRSLAETLGPMSGLLRPPKNPWYGI